MADITSPVWDNVTYPINADHYQLVTWNHCDDWYGYTASYCMDWSSSTCYHPGVDVGMPRGTTLKAPASGVITCAGTGSGPGYDNGWCAAFQGEQAGDAGRIELSLNDGTVVIFGHCQDALVPVGTEVVAGDAVAVSGGYSGDHVHIEQRAPNGSCVAGYEIIDPKPMLTASPPFEIGDTLAVDASEGLNLREGPGLSYDLITTMPWNRKAIVVSESPIFADNFHWFHLETRHGRGWAAGEYMKKVTLPNYTANATANNNLNYIVPNRQATTLRQVYLDSNMRVEVANPGSGTMEGVRYESSHGMGWTGQQYFGGILHQLKGADGQVLDYVRVSIYYTDGTGDHSSPYSVTMDGTWHHVIPFHVRSDPEKTIDWVTIKAIRNSPQAMTFYTDNAWVVEL